MVVRVVMGVVRVLSGVEEGRGTLLLQHARGRPKRGERVGQRREAEGGEAEGAFWAGGTMVEVCGTRRKRRAPWVLRRPGVSSSVAVIRSMQSSEARSTSLTSRKPTVR